MVLTFETRHLVWGEFRELGDHWGLPQLAQKAIPKKKKSKGCGGKKFQRRTVHIKKAPPKHLFCEKKKEIYRLRREMLGSLAWYFWAGTLSTNEKRDMDNLLAASEEDDADEKRKKKR